MCTVGKVWKNWIQKFEKNSNHTVRIIHIFVHIRVKGRNDLKVESGIIKSFPDHKVVGFRSNTDNISSRKERETFLTSLSLSPSHLKFLSHFSVSLSLFVLFSFRRHCLLEEGKKGKGNEICQRSLILNWFETEICLVIFEMFFMLVQVLSLPLSCHLQILSPSLSFSPFSP